jgi:hypothetical protein
MVGITNPPFAGSDLGDPFIRRTLELLDTGHLIAAVLLQRIDSSGTDCRADIFNRAAYEITCCWRPLWIPPPDIVIRDRPYWDEGNPRSPRPAKRACSCRSEGSAGSQVIVKEEEDGGPCSSSSHGPLQISKTRSQLRSPTMHGSGIPGIARFAVPLDLLGGRHRRPGAPRLAAKVAKAIVRAEVGGVHHIPTSEEWS